MKKIKIMIISIIIIIVLLLIALFILMQPPTINGEHLDPEDTEYYVILQKKFTQLKDKSNYFLVKNCVSNYYNSISNLYLDYEEMYDTQDEIEDAEQYYLVSLYNLLFNDYIEDFSISENTLKDKYEKISENYNILLDEILYSDIDERISVYLVKGNVIDNSSKIKINIGIIVDSINNAYKILPEEYLEKHELDNVESEDELQLDLNIDEIEKNESNTFKYENKTNEDMAKEYFNINKIGLLYDVEQYYDKLDKEYKEKKFPNIEQFKQYLNNKYIQINIAKPQKYIVNKIDGNTQYIVYDQYGNYYIFNASSILNYNVMFDIYTIDLPQFVEQYNNSNIQEKCELNIEKIREAINDRDYNYLYNKLADAFKSNYFPTQEAFEQYIDANFYKQNAMEYKKIENQEGSYIFTVSISNIENSAESTIEKTIVIQLKNETDFVFSFSV